METYFIEVSPSKNSVRYSPSPSSSASSCHEVEVLLSIAFSAEYSMPSLYICELAVALLNQIRVSPEGSPKYSDACSSTAFVFGAYRWGSGSGLWANMRKP